jgi:hypothetical protein
MDLTIPFIMFMIRRDKLLLEQGLDFAQCVACIPVGAASLSHSNVDDLHRTVFHLAQDAIMKLYRYKTKGERQNDGWTDDMKGSHFANRLQTDRATVSKIRAFVAKAAPSSRRAMGGCDETNIRSASDGSSKATRSKAESGLMTIVCSHLMCVTNAVTSWKQDFWRRVDLADPLC